MLPKSKKPIIVKNELGKTKNKKSVGVENFQPKKPLDKIKPLSKKQQIEADKFLAEIDEFAKGFEKSGRKEKPKKPTAKSPQPTAKVTIKKKSIKIETIKTSKSKCKKPIGVNPCSSVLIGGNLKGVNNG